MIEATSGGSVPAVARKAAAKTSTAQPSWLTTLLDWPYNPVTGTLSGVNSDIKFTPNPALTLTANGAVAAVAGDAAAAKTVAETTKTAASDVSNTVQNTVNAAAQLGPILADMVGGMLIIGVLVAIGSIISLFRRR